MTAERVKRKPAAILSADVKGYSRLMGEDEVGTIRTLNAYLGAITGFIQKHQGRVVTTGKRGTSPLSPVIMLREFSFIFGNCGRLLLAKSLMSPFTPYPKSISDHKDRFVYETGIFLAKKLIWENLQLPFRSFSPAVSRKTTMATHKNLSRDPFEETAYLELAKTYLKMGRLEDALVEYKILAQHYASWGMKDKAARVMALMARIDSSKAGPQKEITGLKPPMKLKTPEAASNGPEKAGIRKASIDDAIEQFQIAYEKKQNAFGSSHSLGLCFKKKSQWEEAHPAFAKASRADGISRDIILAAKFELALILKEQGKVEEALDLLEEVFIGRSGISQYQRSNRQADIKINEGGKAPAQFCCFTEFDRESQTQKGLGPGKNNQKKSRDRREYYCFYLLCSALLWFFQNQFYLNN